MVKKATKKSAAESAKDYAADIREIKEAIEAEATELSEDREILHYLKCAEDYAGLRQAALSVPGEK